ncbi:MAG: radical SAM protein [Nitrospirae bacterium]|nr:radical SAM protein [Nitrospirota bacterium]MBF0534497.1 radical SAM protein [Nitrospirota bacterium]MBF0617123.1 radical SAM protein [Nitrospirota bacterium]
MANVLLTQQCVRKCPYCFALKHMENSTSDKMLSWENLIYIADLLECSGHRHLSLLGGEPTLHPSFNDFVVYLIERGFDVSVFTSGIMTKDKLSKSIKTLEDVPMGRLTFVCNLNDPALSPVAETVSVKRFLEHFGNRTIAGFNIYRNDFDMNFLFQAINMYGMIRVLRLGLAHRIVGKDNIYVDIGSFDNIIKRLSSCFDIFKELRIKPAFDCGFPMCALNDNQLGQMYRLTTGDFRFYCVPAIDIGPDMEVWPCFPLSSFHKKSLFEFNSFSEVIEYYNDLFSKIQTEACGIFERCDDCVYRENGLCHGGCKAHILSSFRDEPPIRLDEMYVISDETGKI